MARPGRKRRQDVKRKPGGTQLNSEKPGYERVAPTPERTAKGLVGVDSSSELARLHAKGVITDDEYQVGERLRWLRERVFGRTCCPPGVLDDTPRARHTGGADPHIEWEYRAMLDVLDDARLRLIVTSVAVYQHIPPPRRYPAIKDGLAALVAWKQKGVDAKPRTSVGQKCKL